MSDMEEQVGVSLPALQQGLLDAGGVRDLFQLYETHAEIQEISVKQTARQQIEDKSPLEPRIALDQLLAGQVRGVQVLYRYEAELWLDTLLGGGDAFRVVRMRQQFSC